MSTTAPTSMVKAMMSWSRPRCSTSETLSRSLVARLMVSPGWWESKYESGSLPSLDEMSLRRDRLSRSAKLDITMDCTL